MGPVCELEQRRRLRSTPATWPQPRVDLLLENQLNRDFVGVKAFVKRLYASRGSCGCTTQD